MSDCPDESNEAHQQCGIAAFVEITNCARAALDLCPYLGLERHQRRGLTEATAAPGFTDMEKAQPVILAVTWAYDVALIGEPPALMFLPAAWMSATRFDYAAGRLVETGPEPLRQPPS